MQETDENLTQEPKYQYKIQKVADQYLIKKILIKKKPLQYSFIGGMWYSTSSFSLEQNISLPFPFATYYTLKILDKIHQGKICRSLLYVKTPLLIIQFEDECIGINFETKIKMNDEEIIPFICLEEDDVYRKT